MEVNGDDGDLIVDLFSGEIRLRSRKNTNWGVECVLALQPHAGWPGMHECVSAFLDAVESGQPSPVNAEVVAQLHLLGLAAETSKDSGTWAGVEGLESLRSAD